MKRLSKSLLLLCFAATTAGNVLSQNYAWPEQYDGVMLQGFYWDSYSDTKWTNLESQADELSSFFQLIWVPNSAWCGGTRNMGYMPQYWFTNHRSAFGTEEELRSMIATFASKGTGIIADVVVNHRNGVTGWYDFPTEEWNGRTWSIGLDGICSNDEMASNSSQPKPTGARDTGDNFDGCRDLDHTNENVQENVKNYCKFLLDDLGYAGFRYDMVKGYAGKYTGMYNEYAKPRFSVGEYWDGNVTSVTRWIDATGKQSAAFDFPAKYALNNAFHNSNMRLLATTVGGAKRPSGLIRDDYARYSVTFVDNHDTWRDGSRFNGDVPAANAFILTHPGTPCVFLPHWMYYKTTIKRLVRVRRALGINSQSAVTVLSTDASAYLAEVTGTKGTLAVRIGEGTATPDGYTDADLLVSGDKYAVWSHTRVDFSDIPDTPDQGEPAEVITYPPSLYLMGNLATGSWRTNEGVRLRRKEHTYSADEVTVVGAVAGKPEVYFSFASKLATSASDWGTVNSGDRYGAASHDAPVSVGVPVAVKRFKANTEAGSANAWKGKEGTYAVTVDLDAMTMTLSTPSAVSEVSADASASPAVYYNLQGVKVDNPSAGAYIRVSGGRAEKVIIR